MRDLERAVRYYTRGVATIHVPFPEDMTVCQWCPYVRNEDSLKRHKCLLTGEYLPFPFTSRGNQCPVVFEEVDDGQV
jgi:hypothetical protein